MEEENTSNYFNSMTADITPIEFEVLCLDLLTKTSGFNSLLNIKIEHNKIFETYDGTYQIDGVIEYIALGVKNKIIVECKMYKKKIERKIVEELYVKVLSLGANKGIIMSTSGFQSGAQKFAMMHGIALIQVVDGKLLNIQQSFNTDMEAFRERIIQTPKYVPLMYDLNCQFPMYTLNHDLAELERFMSR